MGSPKVFCYATNPFYLAHAKEMRDGARFHTDVSIYQYDEKDWKRAVLMKPSVIQNALMFAVNHGEGLFYVDADARFKRAPDWSVFDGVDIAACFWKRSPNSDGEWLTGTLYFRNTEAVYDFVVKWAELTPQFAGSNTPEQQSLRLMLSDHAKELTVKRLDPEWCFIFDDMRAMYPNANPIIEHLQASREYRRMVE